MDGSPRRRGYDAGRTKDGGRAQIRLDAGENELASLSPSIGLLVNLEQLWLNENPLKTLPAEIHKCEKLKVLDVRDTELEAVPRELGRLEEMLELDIEGTPYAAEMKTRGLYDDPLDTDKLMDFLEVQDKRETLRVEMFDKACAGVYREISDVPEQRERIEALVAAVSDEFPELPDMRNVVRNCDRLLPADPSAHPAAPTARHIRRRFTELRRENEKKRLSAELELKMRALYYDNIDPAAVEGYIRSIYLVDDVEETPLELEDIQFLIKNAARLLPSRPVEITGPAVRASVWRLQKQLTDERETCVKAVCVSLAAVYPDTEPPLVQELGRAVCRLFERDRFATKKELGELKKLAADASSLFPPEFQNAAPKDVKATFRQREHEAKELAAGGGAAQ